MGKVKKGKIRKMMRNYVKFWDSRGFFYFGVPHKPTPEDVFLISLIQAGDLNALLRTPGFIERFNKRYTQLYSKIQSWLR